MLRNQRRDFQELQETLEQAYAALRKAHAAYKEVRGTPAEAGRAERVAEMKPAREAEREDARRNEEKRRERFEHSTPRKPMEGTKEKGREQQKSPTKLTKPHKRKGQTPKAAILEWRSLVEEQLADHAEMTSFPSPPSIGGCYSDGCVAKSHDRISVSYDCQIEVAFDNADVNLKLERLRWHPDKFSACKEEMRDEWVKGAGEVFRVVNGMYEASKSAGKQR